MIHVGSSSNGGRRAGRQGISDGTDSRTAGSTGVASRPGAGSAATTPDSHAPAARPPANWPDGERPCVLVVEDDEHDREIYGRLLCYNGFDVVFAKTGHGALDLASRYPPDLVLLDMGLPDMQGLDVCTRLREQGLPDDVPVVALSGFPAATMSDRALDAGCVQYIEKPASPVAVLHLVESLVGRPPLAGDGRPPVTLDPEG
jgi:CheY-like chemotaxis protein